MGLTTSGEGQEWQHFDRIGLRFEGTSVLRKTSTYGTCKTKLSISDWKLKWRLT